MDVNAGDRPRGRTGGAVVVLVVALAAWLVLLGGIVWAAVDSSLSAGMSHLLADRWGVVTLVDVYTGGLVVAVWMKLWVRSWIAWGLWVIAIAGLGHFTSVTFLVWRALRAPDFVGVLVPPEYRGDG